ncbi:MAG: hypothetical protein HC767_10050 [Akkermansiaceae bacterium]|nr:hypothetical protein [Akkermansiaceae bacterium]
MSGLVSDTHANELFAAYGGSTLLNATAANNDRGMVGIQTHTEADGDTLLGTDADAGDFEDTTPVAGEISQDLADGLTDEISRDFTSWSLTGPQSRSLRGSATYTSRNVNQDDSEDTWRVDTGPMARNGAMNADTTTTEISRAMEPAATADIAHGMTAGLTADLTALLDTASGRIEGMDMNVAHSSQEKAVTAMLPALHVADTSNLAGNGKSSSRVI